MIDDRYYVQHLDRAWAILDNRGPAFPCAARGGPWLFDSRTLAEQECARRNRAALIAEVAA